MNEDPLAIGNSILPPAPDNLRLAPNKSQPVTKGVGVSCCHSADVILKSATTPFII